MIRLNTDLIYDSGLHGVVIHELQHAIQRIEGFAKGGSPVIAATKIGEEQFAKMFPRLEEDYNKIETDFNNQQRDYWATRKPGTERSAAQKFTVGETATKLADIRLMLNTYKKTGMISELGRHKVYQTIAGEVEARNVQLRYKMREKNYPSDLKDTPISSTEDVAREDQIIYFGEGVQQSSSPRVQTSQHTNIAFLKRALGYRAAKAGNKAAAYDLLKIVYKKGKSNSLKNYPDAIIVSAHGVEATGINAIPNAFANRLSDEYGNVVEKDIVISNKPNHTGATAMARLLNKPTFDGPVTRGSQYFLVDDVSTTGSTLQALRQHIEDNGGVVVGTSVLAAAAGGPDIQITNLQVQELSAKFGVDLLKTLKENGIAEEFEQLTSHQAAYLIKFDSTYAIRNSIAAEYQKGADRIFQGTEQSGKSPATDVAAPAANLVQEQMQLNFDAQPTRHETEIPNEKGKTQKVQYETISPDGNYGAQPGVQQAGKVRGKQADSRNIRTVEEVWAQDKNIQFTGTTQVKTAADVAHIMRLLETKSVEHAFAVHLDKKGNSHIQFLSIGGITGTVVDPKMVLAGAIKFGAVKTWLVHNHPSGNMTPSRADEQITMRIARMMRQMNISVEHVIMDTYKQEYLVMDEYGDTEKQSRKNDAAATQKDTPLKTHRFDGMKFLLVPFTQKLNSSESITAFIYGLRFSVMPKSGMLVMNHGHIVLANYIFKNDIDTNELLKNFTDTPTGTTVILYGNQPLRANTLDGIKSALADADIRLLDYINIKGGGSDVQGAYDYNSMSDEGTLHEPGAEYGTNTLSDLLKKVREQVNNPAPETPGTAAAGTPATGELRPVENYADLMINYVRAVFQENGRGEPTAADVIAELEPVDAAEGAELAAYVKKQFKQKQTGQAPPPTPPPGPGPQAENEEEDFIKNYTIPLIERGAENDSLKTDIAAGYSNDILEQDDMVDSLVLDTAVTSLNDFIEQAKTHFGDYVLDYASGLYKAFKNRKDDMTKLGVMVLLKNNLDNERKDIDDIIQGLKSVNPDNAEITLLAAERKQIVQQLKLVADYIDAQGYDASKKLNILRLTKKIRGIGMAPRSRAGIVGPDVDGQANNIEAILDETIGEEVDEDTGPPQEETVEFEAPPAGKRTAASSAFINKAKASVARMKSAKGKLSDLSKEFNKIVDQAKKLC